jgi:hypothetical protein
MEIEMILDGDDDRVDERGTDFQVGDIVRILFGRLLMKEEGKNDVLSLAYEFAIVLLISIPAFIAF